MSSSPVNIQSLLDIMKKLRDPNDGCPWDKKQTFDSIVPCTIEETYEVVDAISRQDWQDVRDELGDLLFQVVFYSQLGEEKGYFNFDDVVKSINDKLLRRHPHVFADNENQIQASDDDEQTVLRQWEAIKSQEREQKAKKNNSDSISVLDDVPPALPALLRAKKLQKRCANVGFDWHQIQPVAEKVEEELQEVLEEVLMVDVDQQRVNEEVGDLLFAVVNLARHVGTDPESALRQANRKFETRFRAVEEKLHQKGKTLQESHLDEMESLWSEVKNEECHRKN